MAEFSRSQVSSGKLIFTAGANEQGTFAITYEEQMGGLPTVVVTVIKSNKAAMAANVTTTGFDLIISDSGMDNAETSFEVHYQAIYVY
jgi:hypothetical protein